MSFDAVAWAVKLSIKNVHAKFVLVVLGQFADERQQAFPSIATIAKQTELSPRAVARALNYLEENNFLKRTRQYRHTKSGGRTANLYQLLMPDLTANMADKGGRLTAKSRDLTAIGGRTMNNHIESKKEEKTDSRDKRRYVPFGSPEHEELQRHPVKGMFSDKKGGFYVPKRTLQ